MIQVARDPNDPDRHELLPDLKKIDVLREGHFVLKQPQPAGQGKHSGHYFDKSLIWSWPNVAEKICTALSHEIYIGVPDLDVVAGPALGAIIPAYSTAVHLSLRLSRQIRSVWVEKDENGRFYMPRLFAEVVKGKRVVVVEDVTTAVASVVEAMKALLAAGAIISGVVFVCNRSGMTDKEIAEKLGVPWAKSLITLSLPTYDRNVCPYCQLTVDRRPINVSLGYGADFASLYPSVAEICGTTK